MVTTLWAYLADLLEGHRIIYVFDKRFYKLKLSKYNPLQALAIDMLLHKKCIGLGSISGRVFRVFRAGDREYIFLSGSGDIISELIYPVSKNSKFICWDDLSGSLPKRPLFIVDNSLYHELHPKDQNRLVYQLSLFLKVFRKYLFDTHLLMNNSPIELYKKFNSVAGYNMVRWTNIIDLVNLLNKDDRIIALDPYAEDIADENVLRNATVTIIGGIVDREKPIKMATKRIVDALSRKLDIEITRYRLEIDGIREAVPHRINILGEIILEAIFNKKSLKKSIIEHMSNRDIAWYIGLKIMKEKLDHDKVKEIVSEIEEYRKIKIKDHVLRRAYRIAGIKV